MVPHEEYLPVEISLSLRLQIPESTLERHVVSWKCCLAVFEVPDYSLKAAGKERSLENQICGRRACSGETRNGKKESGEVGEDGGVMKEARIFWSHFGQSVPMAVLAS